MWHRNLEEREQRAVEVGGIHRELCVCVCAQNSQGHPALLSEIICSIIYSNAHCQINMIVLGYSMSILAGDVQQILDHQEIGW